MPLTNRNSRLIKVSVLRKLVQIVTHIKYFLPIRLGTEDFKNILNNTEHSSLKNIIFERSQAEINCFLNLIVSPYFKDNTNLDSLENTYTCGMPRGIFMLLLPSLQVCHSIA